MTHGLGLKIGPARAIAALADGNGAETVLTRPATLTFGPSTVRLGDQPGDTGVVAGFADRIGEAVVAGDGLHYRGEDLVAAAAHCLITEAAPPEDTPIVLAHPAVLPARDIAVLRAALDAAGLGQVGLVADPVAVLAWHEFHYGLTDAGLALVYHLGATSLDLTLVAFGAGSGPDPIVGQPLHSTEFGGRHLAAAQEGSVAAVVAGSLELVAACLDVADVNVADLDVVVLAGEGAHVPVVRELLSGALGTPIVCAPEPGHASACGAAVLAASSQSWHSATAFERAAATRRLPRIAGAITAAAAAAAVLAVPWLPGTTSSRPDAAPHSDITTGYVIDRQSQPPRVPADRSTYSPPAGPSVPLANYATAVPVVFPVLDRPPLIEPVGEVPTDSGSIVSTTPAPRTSADRPGLAAAAIPSTPHPRAPTVTPNPTPTATPDPTTTSSPDPTTPPSDSTTPPTDPAPTDATSTPDPESGDVVPSSPPASEGQPHTSSP